MLMTVSRLQSYIRETAQRGFTEYAEYTSAQERIALGKKSKKKEAQKRRAEMSEMIVDA